MDGRDDALEPEPADDHAVADSTAQWRPPALRRAAAAVATGSRNRVSTTASTAARASLRAAPVSPVETGCRAASRAIASVFAFSAGDHVVDFARALRAPALSSSSFSRCRNVSSRCFSASSRCRIRASSSLERLALARREPMLVLERPHVAIDLGEMFGELRFARAQILRAPRR